MESLKAPPPRPTPVMCTFSAFWVMSCVHTVGSHELAPSTLQQLHKTITRLWLRKFPMGDKKPAGHRWCLSGGRLFICMNTEIPRAAINGWDNSAKNTLTQKTAMEKTLLRGELCAFSKANWQGLSWPFRTWMKPLKFGISLKASGTH